MIDMRNIQVLPSGHHRVRVEHRGAVLTGTVETLDEALELRDELKRKIVDGQLVPVRGSSALDNGPRFLASRAGNRSVSDDEGRWHKHIATAVWARRALQTITRKDGVEWLNALKKKRTDYDPDKHGKRVSKPLSWGQRRHCLNLARRFFAWAIEQELVTANPFLDLQIERQDGDEDEGYQEGWYLNVDEQRWLFGLYDTLTCLDWNDRAEKWIVLFAMGTGLRLREAWSLHLSDVHVDGEDPHVMVRFGSWDAVKERYRSPKGRKGERKPRKVPLWGPSLEAARRWLEIREEYVQASAETVAKYRAQKHNPLDLMFPTERGHRRDAKPPRSFRKLVKLFGVVPRIGRPIWWHLLRHTCASSMVSGAWGMRWEQLQDVQTILGHTDIRTTQIYAHLAPSAVQASAARANAAFPLAKVLPFRRHDADTPAPAALASGENLRARPAGFEPATYGSGGRTKRQIAEEIERRDGAVSAIRHVLELVADGQVTVTEAQLDGLRCALDLALTAYAESVARASGGHS